MKFKYYYSLYKDDMIVITDENHNIFVEIYTDIENKQVFTMFILEQCEIISIHKRYIVANISEVLKKYIPFLKRYLLDNLYDELRRYPEDSYHLCLLRIMERNSIFNESAHEKELLEIVKNVMRS